MGNLVLLHIGCANRYIKGFINSDLRKEWKGKPFKLDQVMDITIPWPYLDESVDGIISMHLFQQLTWRELVTALRESYRVLVKGGVMRIGVPTIENGKPLNYLLGWKNINLFSYELLDKVLIEHIGFISIRQCKYQESKIPDFVLVDNRQSQTMYIEVTK
jgi:predicted SAM-dependent methyltransferase